MHKHIFMFVTAILLLSFATSSNAVDYMVGGFETSVVVPGGILGTTLDTAQGWVDWQGFSAWEDATTGATEGSKSLKEIPGVTGYKQGLAFKVQNLADNVNAFQGFLDNTHLAIDVTWVNSEWMYNGAGWNGCRLMMYYNGQDQGFNLFGATSSDPTDVFLVPHIDSGNATNPGFWDNTGYPGVHTRTVMWDYSSFLATVTSTGTAGWTEFIMGSVVSDSFGGGHSFYFDNVRFTTPTTGTPGDFDEDGDVDGRDFLAWQRGESPNPLSPIDLDEWRANYGSPPPAVAVIAAVPEPGSIFLVVGTCGLMTLTRRIAISP